MQTAFALSLGVQPFPFFVYAPNLFNVQRHQFMSSFIIKIDLHSSPHPPLFYLCHAPSLFSVQRHMFKSSMSSDISSPPLSVFIMLLTCSVSSDTFSSRQYQWHKFPSPLFWRGIFSDDEWPFELPNFALQCSSISRSHGLVTLMERFPSGRCATIHCEGSSPNTWFGFRWPLNSL